MNTFTSAIIVTKYVFDVDFKNYSHEVFLILVAHRQDYIICQRFPFTYEHYKNNSYDCL